MAAWTSALLPFPQITCVRAKGHLQASQLHPSLTDYHRTIRQSKGQPTIQQQQRLILGNPAFWSWRSLPSLQEDIVQDCQVPHSEAGSLSTKHIIQTAGRPLALPQTTQQAQSRTAWFAHPTKTSPGQHLEGLSQHLVQPMRVLLDQSCSTAQVGS